MQKASNQNNQTHHERTRGEGIPLSRLTYVIAVTGIILGGILLVGLYIYVSLKAMRWGIISIGFLGFSVHVMLGDK